MIHMGLYFHELIYSGDFVFANVLGEVFELVCLPSILDGNN